MTEIIAELGDRKKLLLRRGILLLIDAFIVWACMIGAIWIRYECHFSNIDPQMFYTIEHYLFMTIVITWCINTFFHLYSSLWRFASTKELQFLIASVICSTLIPFAGMKLMHAYIPRSYPLLYGMLCFILTTASRFSYRFGRIYLHNRREASGKIPINTMVIGAGAAGALLITEMLGSKHLNRKIPCIIDDDPSKKGTFLHGIPIIGNQEQISKAAKDYDIEEIIVAIPTISKDAERKLLNKCQETSCKVKILPGVYQMVNEEVNLSQLRDIEIEDLLGRDPIDLKMESIMSFVSGKVVLVTGGGGSIGSELCRQIALHDPEKLIIVDIYENNAYDIQLELRKNYPELNLEVLIASVRNETRIDRIFHEYHPDLVFHAAAHKHVPLMEDSPNEAIKNNVLGTWNVAKICHRYHAKKMVLISTDKAVRPTNIMGASKRVCEIIVEYYSQISTTEYAAVRFGNVLGSNGSVIPIFKKQIEEGGPVTVTHPDIIRYFMTIPEAVNLVLQCGARAKGGEIFILDMGEPVRIVDLARNMIRLTGKVPDKDIKIEFTGLRPGEKLYEELLINEKNLIQTENKRIFVAQLERPDAEKTGEQLMELIEYSFLENSDIREHVQVLVPEYTIKKE